MHYFDDVWFLEPHSLNSAKDIYDNLVPFIDGEKDYLLVTEITSKDYYGWLPKDAWEYLRARNFQILYKTNSAKIFANELQSLTNSEEWYKLAILVDVENLILHQSDV